MQLHRRVLGYELARRIPGAVVRSFAPFGWQRPSALDGGEAAEPLGPWTLDSAERLAHALDLIVLVPGPFEPTNTGAWARAYAVTAAEADAIARWFNSARHGSAAVAVATLDCDLGALAQRWFPDELLERRQRFHARMGWQSNRLFDPHSLEDAMVDWIARAGPEDPALVAAADHRLDELAKLADGDASGAEDAAARVLQLEAELDDLRAAFAARGERLAAERYRFGQHLDAVTMPPHFAEGARRFMYRVVRSLRRRLRRG